MKRILAYASLAAVLVILGLACDSASPVAPSGTLLSISASPNEIGTTGKSSIRVTALRSNGTPVNPGTIIRLDTTLGTITEQVETDDQGVARAELTGDGRIGTATVTARSGSAESATVEVMVGKLATSVSLQATPSSVPETGANVTLLALIRDDQGQPLPGASVNFGTEIGTLDSGGGFLFSDANGQAIDHLAVTESDISTLGDDDFQVSVEVGGSGQTVSENFNVSVQRPPDARFQATRNQLTVVFEDLSTNNPTSWLWNFGDPDSSIDTRQNPSFDYSQAGTYTVTLTVRNAIGEDSSAQNVTVSDQ